ncbi:MATE efflux family protein [Rippkaea orientalis PCC 8801]|uniref:MATE efflux family protein n=1 Tax=Rippkaea orientalis (strain PCC 8801 / RF-1) TaxID=41431 RepID=B7JZM1_RIPO1|nr:guanitoxin biosynthesis MATE family efflux transporter GntT [Rippkaea orientalis]ACK64964.1 MATE efflux family protein [Rippkaea orientalis PCC 8801]
MFSRNSDRFGFDFIKLTVTNILSNIMIPLAGLVDLAFLGHLTDIRHLAGVALATILFDYLYRTCKFLRMTTTGTTAQAVGREEPDTVLLTLLRHGFLALIVAAIILLLQHPLRELGFTILTAVPDVKQAGTDYFNARIWGAPAALMNFVVIGWFLGRKQSNIVLIMSLVGNGVNILLDYWFIMRLGWNSVGAGAATAISQYGMLLLGIIVILWEGWLLQLPKVAQKIFQLDAMKSALGINFDIWIRTLASVSTFAIFTNLSSAFGTLILASNSLMIEVINLAVFLIEGSAFATETFAGAFYGEGRRENLPSLLGFSAALSVSLGGVLALIFIIFPEPMFGLLTNHQEVIEQINQYTLWLLPILIILSVVYMLEGYFLGLTQVLIIRNSMLMAAIIGFLPLAICAWQFKNVHLLWTGLLLFMGTRALTLGLSVPQSFNEDELASLPNLNKTTQNSI